MATATWDRIMGKWHQVKGDARARWGKLTDDDLLQIAGQREKLAGKLQERYGLGKEEVNRQIDEWANKLKI
jgi:uncharacterized protein YjbJ (UPF0337 family)